MSVRQFYSYRKCPCGRWFSNCRECNPGVFCSTTGRRRYNCFHCNGQRFPERFCAVVENKKPCECLAVRKCGRFCRRHFHMLENAGYVDETSKRVETSESSESESDNGEEDQENL